MVVGANAPLADFGSRPRSIGKERLTRKERRELVELRRSLAMGRHYKRRPKTVGECAKLVPGPCPWVGCRFNLFLDVDEDTGVIRINFPGKEIDELEETCALRVAASGEHTLVRTGQLLNVTEERLRQLEEVALMTGRSPGRGGRCGGQPMTLRAEAETAEVRRRRGDWGSTSPPPERTSDDRRLPLGPTHRRATSPDPPMPRGRWLDRGGLRAGTLVFQVAHGGRLGAPASVGVVPAPSWREGDRRAQISKPSARARSIIRWRAKALRSIPSRAAAASKIFFCSSETRIFMNESLAAGRFLGVAIGDIRGLSPPIGWTQKVLTLWPPRVNMVVT